MSPTCRTPAHGSSLGVMADDREPSGAEKMFGPALVGFTDDGHAGRSQAFAAN